MSWLSSWIETTQPFDYLTTQQLNHLTTQQLNHQQPKRSEEDERLQTYSPFSRR